ncbi:hypothetical protein [Blastococcus sp. SYSU DS0973]
MSIVAGRTTSTGPRRAGRAASALIAAAVGIGGLAACSDESAGAEAGGVTAQDLEAFEDQLADLAERVGALEEGMGDDGVAATTDDTAGFFEDTRSYVGQDVTVSGEISELVSTTDVGSSFRLAGESGELIAVVMATQPMELDADDVVRVSGTVVQVQRDTFEEDFGIAAEELFADADAWFEQEESSAAISAHRVEVTQQQGQND